MASCDPQATWLAEYFAGYFVLVWILHVLKTSFVFENFNQRTAGGLSHLRTAGGGGG